MPLNLLVFTLLCAVGALSQCTYSGNGCKWPENMPYCPFTNDSSNIHIGVVVNGWQLKAWSKGVEHEKNCSSPIKFDNCCEEYGVECLLGSKRLWCQGPAQPDPEPSDSLLQKRNCPPEQEKLEAMVKPLYESFQKSLCDKGIKVGGSKDMGWAKENIYAQYLTQKFIGKMLPAGLEKDEARMRKKCHRASYDYCKEADREKVADCFKEFAAELIMKYSMQVPGYCSYIDKIVNEWPVKHQEGALRKIEAYAEWKAAGQ